MEAKKQQRAQEEAKTNNSLKKEERKAQEDERSKIFEKYKQGRKHEVIQVRLVEGIDVIYLISAESSRCLFNKCLCVYGFSCPCMSRSAGFRNELNKPQISVSQSAGTSEISEFVWLFYILCAFLCVL